MPFIGKQSSGHSKIKKSRFTATASQTAFSVVSAAGDELQVFLNGVLLKETDDYTYTTSTVTLGTGASVNDIVEVHVYQSFTIADTVDIAGDTMTGELEVPTVKLSSNVIKASDGGSTITLDNSDNVTLAGNLVIPDGGNIGSASDTDAISIASNGQVTFSPNTLATQSEVFGTHTTGSITSGTTSLTVASGSGISNGDFVVGEGITPGTTVSSGGGTTSITLSANANATLSSDPVMFYSATKLLTPGLVGGMLCRAWVNFNGTGTVAIRGSNNVSSITDGGTGVFRINFTTNLDSADYAISQGQQSYASCTRGLFFSSGSAVDDTDIADPTVTGFWVKVEAGGSTRYDPTGACISVFL